MGGYLSYYSSWYIFIVPALILSAFAQMKVMSAYEKYSEVSSGTMQTGAQTARQILDRNGLNNVRIEMVNGKLSDHYDPRTEVVRLSRDVYSGNSIASLAIAAHEVGHAIQHAEEYKPLSMRSAIAPLVSIASGSVWIFILLGFILSGFFIDLAIALFIGVVLFQVITLPVEINASRRALVQLEDGIMPAASIGGAKKVLSAAALTYVAAAIASIAELLRILYVTRDRRN